MAAEADLLSALITVVKKGAVEDVDKLLLSNPDLVNKRLTTANGYTALHVASRMGDVKMCRVLLEHGADMESVDTSKKETPFMMAAKKGHVPVLQLLVKAGCDVQVRNRGNDGALARASLCGRLEAVQFLIASGLSVNDKHGQDSWTALHWACWGNEQSVAEFLILSGADVTARSIKGRLPFELADEPLRTTVKFAQLYGEGSVTLECVKICLIGPAEAGKTTLFKAIRWGWLSSFVSADETAEETSAFEERTVGMEVYEAYISSAGHVMLCDFAGQRHFHRTHSLFFGPSNTIYLLLINGRQSEEQMLADSQFWLAFLSASSPPHSRPVVVIVVSRADLHSHPIHLQRIIHSVVSKLKSLFEVKLNVQQRHFILDCRKSRSSQMKELRDFIAHIKKALLQTKRRYPRLCESMVKKMLPHLRKTLDHPLMTQQAFVETMEQFAPGLGKMKYDVRPLAVDFLHTVGEIFTLDDLIFLLVSWLSSAVLGPVMETKYWSRHAGPHCATVTKEQLTAIINEFQLLAKGDPIEINGDHAVKALEQLGVCFELEDHPGLYCIPAHLPDKDRRDEWLVDPEMKIHMGQRVQCQDETDMFTPGLFPFFQSHVVVKKIDPMARMCNGWMKLVKVHEGSVITECLAEMSRRERAIDVVVRGPAGSKQQCVSFLNTVMDTLAKVMNKKSQGTLIDRYFLSPSHLRQGRKNPAGFKEDDVAEAQRKNEEVVRTIDGDTNVAERVDELLVGEGEVDPRRVVCAVQKHGSTRWYALGSEMGFSRDQLESCTASVPQQEDKLQAVFHETAQKFGERRAAAMLLEACGDIFNPIIGRVQEELQ